MTEDWLVSSFWAGLAASWIAVIAALLTQLVGRNAKAHIDIDIDIDADMTTDQHLLLLSMERDTYRRQLKRRLLRASLAAAAFCLLTTAGFLLARAYAPSPDTFMLQFAFLASFGIGLMLFVGFALSSTGHPLAWWEWEEPYAGWAAARDYVQALLTDLR